MNQVSFRVIGRVVLGRLRYNDDREPEYHADLVFVDPSASFRLGLLGLGAQLAGSAPWMLTNTLPGASFGAAVAHTLPSELKQAILGGKRHVFTEIEVADLLRPVLDAVAKGQLILGGVPAPPSADPEYVPFSPTMLPWWRFIAGDDAAESLVPGATSYVALRVFTPLEFGFVQRCDGKLRPLSDVIAAAPVTPRRTGCAGRPSSANLAKVEMQRRADAGQMLSTLIEEAEHLVAWLQAAHPKEPQPKAKSLSDALRDEYRILKSRKS